MPSDLICPACERTYPAGPTEPWRCSCGHALEFTDAPCPTGTPPPLSQIDTSEGLWTFSQFLPIEKHVSFHEGFTPLLEAPEWNAQFKLEYVFPTGSFKDRGATTTLSRAVELGVEKVIEDSSGNAGASIATYAAHAGLEADIYVPAAVTQSKLMAIQRADAKPIRVEGSRDDVTAACIDAVEAGDGWYASHAWNPAFFAGTMTFALEVVAQRQWRAPDAVVVPLGHGTLFLGAYRGFQRLFDGGIIDHVPRLLGAQAAGYAPIVDAFGGETVDDTGTGTELTDGIKIKTPARSLQLLEALEATDGDVVALGSDPIESALDRLHREGYYVEPTCAVAPAALQWFRDTGVLTADDDVVVPLTGSGFKTL